MPVGGWWGLRHPFLMGGDPILLSGWGSSQEPELACLRVPIPWEQGGGVPVTLFSCYC